MGKMTFNQRAFDLPEPGHYPKNLGRPQKMAEYSTQSGRPGKPLCRRGTTV